VLCCAVLCCVLCCAVLCCALRCADPYSDVIYDKDATRALFRLLRGMLGRRRLLISLEKRFNFELSTLSVEPHGYSVFLDHVSSRVARHHTARHHTD
jgi:hypothetical protein